jgi:hypothetical protein
MIGVGLSWCNAATLVFRKKFSASRFWEDARVSNSTVIQYIGEICRFLLATPESPLDKKSKYVRTDNSHGAAIQGAVC